MDFLKRHYEKIVLAVALVALIVSAIYLALQVNAISNAGPTTRASTHVTPTLHVPLATYSNAILTLAEPPLWTNGVAFIPISSHDDIPPTHLPGTNAPPPPFPVTLVSLVRKPFKLLFMTYSYEATTGGYNFQINFQFRARTFFIPAIGDVIRDHYEDTGYRITKFEKKSVVVDDPTLGTKRDKDVSELTVQHEGNSPVVLVLSRESEDQEPVAEVRCAGDGQTGEYRRGQSFTCKGVTYKVIEIDINQKHMVIVDTQTQEQHTIKYQQ
ncbi:MAG: hypothetical protein ABSD58_13505 [Verrucomicrobiia bacterium]|jgi:hypothetical protein